jgi:hypothetical protein
MISKITSKFDFEEKNPEQQWKSVLFREIQVNKLNELKNKINELIDSVDTINSKLNVFMKSEEEEN